MVKKKRRLPVPKKGTWIETRRVVRWRDKAGVKHSRGLPRELFDLEGKPVQPLAELTKPKRSRKKKS
jgi:hypothetical protein